METLKVTTYSVEFSLSEIQEIIKRHMNAECKHNWDDAYLYYTPHTGTNKSFVLCHSINEKA